MQTTPAKATDAEKIHRIHTSAVKTTCKDFYTQEQIKAWLKGRSAEGYQDPIARGEMYLAKEDDEVLGFGHAVPGEIAAVYVDPSHSGKGVGKMLLEHGLKIASKDHQKVKVESTVNAEGFYEKYGFMKAEESYVTRNRVKIPTVVMEFSK